MELLRPVLFKGDTKLLTMKLENEATQDQFVEYQFIDDQFD